MIKGQCHCGNIKLQLPQLTENATTCNCSICARYGAIWGYFTRTEVKVAVGESGFSAYSHGDKMINFNHCKKCGCLTHYTSTDPSADSRLAVNYRMFPSTVIQQINIRHFDGADSWQHLD